MERQAPETFEARRTIDVNDRRALRFWARRLGVTTEAITEAIRDVGANTTAVVLKLDAPAEDRIVPPSLAQR